MDDIQEEALESKRVLIQNEDADSSDQSSESVRSRQSCTAFCSLLSSVVRNLNCKRKKKRTDQVDLSCTPQNGLMVRMIGESSKEDEVAPDEAGEVSTLKVCDNTERRTSRHSDVDEGRRTIFLPRVGSFSGGQEAEERLLSRVAGRTPSSRPRFLTLHKRRKRRPPTRGLLSNSALLDDLYNGPTQCVLSRVALWDFNAFALDSVCGGRPVAVLCVFLLHEYNLLKEFRLDTVTVWKCFSLIEEGYHASNPYHNAIHAADVTQAMHCYLQETTIAKYLTPFEKLAAIIASVCHDLDHPGVNQPFLIATDNHLAALYNNASVLENHHWRCAMGCLWESGILENWSSDSVSLLQEEIRSLILATDITRQNEFLSKFKKYQESQTLDMTVRECRHFSLQIALKCADICNPCRPWEVSRIWSHKICDEFYRQGDYERQLRLPVTALCDRYVNSVAKTQTGFIKFVVSPLFDSWNNWLGTELSSTMQMYMRQNLIRWENFLLEEKLRQDEERLTPQVCSASSTTSSVGSHLGSVLGSMEPASLCLPVGRRYSLPLTVPSLLPRTVIRRESLCETGQSPLILETVQMGEMSVASVVTSSFHGSGNMEFDDCKPESMAEMTLYPEPTIAAMGEVGRPRKSTMLKVGRRQSLPPLWDASFVPTRTFAPLEALPATPVQEETPTELEKDPPPSSAKPQGCETSQGQDSSSTANEAPSSDSANNGEALSSDSTARDAIKNDSVAIEAINSETREPIISDSATIETPISHSANKSVLSGALKERAITQRSSMDSCKRDSKPDNCVSKWPRLDGNDIKLHNVRSIDPVVLKNTFDKENMAPLPERTIERHILKTRLWRSLNQDEEIIPENRTRSIYKNFNQSYVRGRRGSAPILKLEALRVGLRCGTDVNSEYLSRRRGSAPSNHVHSHLGHQCYPLHVKSKFMMCGGLKCGIPRGDLLNYPKRRVRGSLRILNRGNSFSLIEPYLKISGSDGSLLNADEKLCQVPLLSKEDQNGNVNPRNALRRGSMPSEVNGDNNFIPEVHNQSQVFDGVNSSHRVSRGCYGGGDLHDLPIFESNSPIIEERRGSRGFELLSGLWRYHLGQKSNSLCSDDSVGMSSSGGATPGTPGTIGPLLSYQVSPGLYPSPYYRRGSLPSDVYTSVDMRVWINEAS